MMEDINERGALCTKRRCVVLALIFLAATALCRALDILSASWGADVMASGTLADAAGIASVILSVAAVSFSGGAAAFAALYGKGGTPYFAASLFSAVVLTDRTFHIIYSVATNVKTFSAGAGAEAYIRVISDALFFAAAYFLTAFAGSRAVRKNEERRSPVIPVLVFSAALTVGQLLYQTYITVRFFSSYDDVTAVEKSGIAADYFFILLKYGVVMFGAAIAFFSALRAVYGKIGGKKEKNR